LRIFPGATANTLFCVALAALITRASQAEFWEDPATWRYLAHNLSIVVAPTQFQLPGAFQTSRWPIVNGSIWTIKYELLCYLTLLGIYWLMSLTPVPARRALFGAAALLACGYIYRISAYPNPDGIEFFGPYNAFNLLRFFMTFLAGAAYAACEPLSARARLTFLAAPASLIIFGPTPQFARAGIILLLTLFVIEVGKSQAFFSRTYRKVGDLSYGTFLYAYPIQNLIVTRFYNGQNFVLVTIACLAAIMICAFVSWRFVEKPALRLKW
jgi:peptidoglycan/LPS O-acetylase OafA/YrhL